MTIIQVLNKYDSMDVDKVMLNYDGDESEFDTIEDAEDEAYENGFDDEDVVFYKLRNRILKIEM